MSAHAAPAGADQELVSKHRKPESLIGKLRFRLSKTKLRATAQWLRHRGFRPADMFFSTYPRSGTTWTRFTMFEILTGEGATFESVNSVIVLPGAHDRARPVLPCAGRLISTHESYRKEYKRAVYLVRDVRDVILSEYAFVTALDRFHGSLDDFITGFFRWQDQRLRRLAAACRLLAGQSACRHAKFTGAQV